MAGLTYKDWLTKTSVFGKTRSVLLREVDSNFELYEKFGGAAAKWRLEQALDAWKKSKGPGETWKKDPRNTKARAVEELTAILKGGGDTDKDIAEVPEFMQSGLINSRLGVVYLFSHMRVETNLFNVVLEGALSATGKILEGAGTAAASAASSITASVMIPGSQLLQAAETAVQAPKTPQGKTLFERVKEWLTSFGKKILEELEDKFGKVDLTISALKNVITVFASEFASKAEPFISGGMDLAKGVVNTLDATYTLFKTWLSGKGVELLSGHPTVIVDSIKRSMKINLAEGLFQAVKGAVSLANAGAAAATGGLSVLLNALVAMGCMIIKLIMRMVELLRIDKFIKEASAAWTARFQPDALHKQPINFGRWYKKYAMSSPSLAVLTLNSGICGDKMLYLKMYKSDDTIITASNFERGCVFLDDLKVWGSKYLDDCNYNFYSDDAMVENYLTIAKSFKGNPGMGSKAWDFLVKAANA